MTDPKLRERLQQAWDASATLPPIVFAEHEADALIAAAIAASLTTPPARSYADEDRVTIARALAERFIERGNARVTGSVHASWEAMPWSYRRDFLADADAVIKVLSRGGKA